MFWSAFLCIQIYTCRITNGCPWRRINTKRKEQRKIATERRNSIKEPMNEHEHECGSCWCKESFTFCLVSRKRWQKLGSFELLLLFIIGFLWLNKIFQWKMCIRRGDIIHLPPFLMHVRSNSDLTLWSGWITKSHKKSHGWNKRMQSAPTWWHIPLFVATHFYHRYHRQRQQWTNAKTTANAIYSK